MTNKQPHSFIDKMVSVISSFASIVCLTVLSQPTKFTPFDSAKASNIFNYVQVTEFRSYFSRKLRYETKLQENVPVLLLVLILLYAFSLLPCIDNKIGFVLYN